jgi:hypothetical protein
MTNEKRISDIEKKISRIGSKENHGDFGDVLGSILLSPGLRGFWPISSSDESRNIYDISGQERTMTNAGSATIINSATYNYVPYIDLNGSTQYFSRADEAGLDITGALTLGLWFYPDTTNTCALFSKMGTAGTYSYQITHSTTNDAVFSVSSDGTNLFSATGSGLVVSGRWNFIVGRYFPSSSVRVICNGQSATNTTSIPAAIYNSATALYIGGNGNGDRFDGRIAFPFICSGALSDVITTRIHNSTRWIFGV